MKGNLRNRISRFFNGLTIASEVGSEPAEVQQKPREPKPIKTLPPHFDPTFPLETLPFDIKYALLEATAFIDYDAFVSLILASRAYHEVFTQHKRALTHVALWHDALKYKEESFFIVSVHDGLLDSPRAVSKDESERIEDAYNDAIDPRGFGTEPWYYAAVREGGEDVQNKVVKNHLAVQRLANIFIKRAMFPRLLRRVKELEESQTKKGKKKQQKQEWQQRPEPYRKYGEHWGLEELNSNEPPATASERQRIMKAIYHLTIYILIMYTRLSAQREIEYTRGNIRFILIWGYWETKAVEMLMAWLGKELNPLFYKLFREGRWWWAWNAHIPRLGEDNFDADGSEPEIPEGHHSCSLFALLFHEFPLYAAEWMASFNANWSDWDPPADRLKAMTDWTSDINTRLVLGTAHWMMPHLLYYANYREPPAPEVETKPMCVKGLESFSTKADYLTLFRFGADDEFLWGRPGGQRVDPWMVLWDDWRLERWGYVLPVLQKEV
ncbi:hypothetical protein TWF506_011238 [Arthrobotrys conoides]|uniref:Uncharacterized protein n=1 Tax=Arthrobotrys conoides TaxID=74498 RepID=A0AAN8N0U5_9PEZI